MYSYFKYFLKYFLHTQITTSKKNIQKETVKCTFEALNIL